MPIEITGQFTPSGGADAFNLVDPIDIGSGNINEVWSITTGGRIAVSGIAGELIPQIYAGVPVHSASLGTLCWDSSGESLYVNSDGATTWNEIAGGAGSGDVVGPASSTNNALVVYDGTTGKLIKNSTVTLSSGAFSSVDTINFTGTKKLNNVATIVGSDPIDIQPFDVLGEGLLKITNSSNAVRVQIGSVGVTGATLETDTIETTNAGDLTIAPDGVVAIPTNTKIQFRDSAIYIHSDADGYLLLVADTGIKLNNDLLVDTIADLSATGLTITVSNNLTLNPAGVVAIDTNKKIQFRDSAIYIHSDADGYLTIAADTAVKINKLEGRYRQIRVPFFIRDPEAGDIIPVYVAGHSGSGAKLIYSKILRIAHNTVTTSSTLTFNGYIRTADSMTVGGTSVFSSAKSSSTTYAEETTFAADEIDATADGSADECLVIEIVSIGGTAPSYFHGWVSIELQD